MAKAIPVKVSSTVRAIVALDVDREVTNGKGNTSVYTHRMHLNQSPSLNAAHSELSKVKNENGKPLSFGSLTSNGTFAVDLKAGEAKRLANMAGAMGINQLVGASYQGTIVYRPKGSTYETRDGETLEVGSTHVAREDEQLKLTMEQLNAIAYASAMIASSTAKKEDEVIQSFGFGSIADAGNDDDESLDTGFQDGEGADDDSQESETPETTETPVDDLADVVANKKAAKAGK